MKSLILKLVNGIGGAIYQKGILLSVLFVNLTIAVAFGQTGKEVEITLEGIESLGNGKYAAHFSYNNPNTTDIAISDTSSSISVSDQLTKKIKAKKSKSLTKFKAGKQAFAFDKEFSGDEEVSWTIVLPNGVTKKVSASKDSKKCTILPSYTPPSNGKHAISILGPELASLFESFSATGALGSKSVFIIRDSKVLIEIKSTTGNFDKLLDKLITKTGFTSESSLPGNNLITGWIPIINLMSIQDYAKYVEYVRPVFPSIINNSGRALNLGDYSLHSDVARKGYGITGKGVKVGVLSDSYDSKGLSGNDVINGDLPGAGNIDGNLQNVEIVKEFPYTSSSLIDEGRGMLQIVHDIAPGANLAFRTGFVSPVDMAAGIIELADNGCDIIIDDITHITEPFFSDGIVSQAVNTVATKGVSYFSAAGNYGKKSYSAAFIPSKITLPAGITGTAHDFGSGDIFQNVTLKDGNYLIVMQW